MQMRSYKRLSESLTRRSKEFGHSLLEQCVGKSIKQKTSGFLSPLGVPQKQHDSPPDMQVYICLCQTIALRVYNHASEEQIQFAIQTSLP